MTAPLREQFKNLATTVLDGSINDSVTSLDVTDGSVLPSTGNFRIVIGSEIMLVTARSSDTLTVVRGAESTTPASHTDGDDVAHVVTSGSLAAMGLDNNPAFGYAPALGKLVADDGTTILTTSDFTKRDGSVASTATDVNGGIILVKGATSGSSLIDLSVLLRTTPSPPYSYIAGIQGFIPSGVNNTSSFGMIFLKNSNDDFYLLEVGTSHSAGYPYHAVRTNVDLLTASSMSDKLGIRPFIQHSNTLWMKLEDDNTNVNFYLSNDGVNWIKTFGEARTTFLAGGPDRIGVYIASTLNTLSAYVKLVHWSRAT